ncbi:MAG TPA: hypothetical protein VLH09_12435 [Bryobacteraceae bacterium]|nr:hypothetical protein [Bryobacteraceae bacterium]
MRILVLAAVLTPALGAEGPAKPPEIVGVTVHQYEDGPAVPSGNRFIPGETVFVSFQVRGYSVSPDSKVLLTYRIEATDSGGVPLVEPDSGRIETEIAPQDKEWLPKVRYSALIPPHALPGKYRVAALVRDGRSATDAKVEVWFSVQAREVDTSGPFAVRNVRFFRSEEDQRPMATPAYRAGEAFWARFDITGFKLGDKNRVEVLYGVSIVSPAGKVLFSEPEAALEEDTSFYPRRHVPGVFSLTVQPKTTPGEYTLAVTARDLVGDQTAETRSTFRIE